MMSESKKYTSLWMDTCINGQLIVTSVIMIDLYLDNPTPPSLNNQSLLTLSCSDILKCHNVIILHHAHHIIEMNKKRGGFGFELLAIFIACTTEQDM